MSPRWGSIEQSIVFYKNAAPLELKGRTAKQLLECIFVLEPQRGEILVDLMYFVLEPQRGDILMAHFNQVLSIRFSIIYVMCHWHEGGI